MATGRNMDSLADALDKCMLFNGIPEEKYGAVLKCLSGQERHYSGGTLIDLVEGKGRRVGVILSGRVSVNMYSAEGKSFCLNQLKSGDVFGNDLINAAVPSSLQIETASDSDILYLDFNPLFISGGTCPYKARVTRNLLEQMSEELAFMGGKIRLLAEPRLRERIRLYLSTLKPEGGALRIPMSRGEMASYLCVDRSALSRELGRMQEDGLIEVDGRTVRVTSPGYLC